jgi:hypothetical protein
MIKFSVESDAMNEYVVPHTQDKKLVMRGGELTSPSHSVGHSFESLDYHRVDHHPCQKKTEITDMPLRSEATLPLRRDPLASLSLDL